MTGREDLMLGFRLAVGGGRGSIVRLVLSTAGIGLAVAILLLGASAGTIKENRDQRTFAASVRSEAVPGADPLDYAATTTDFRGQAIALVHLRPTGPNSPIPPGVDRLPAPGEVFLSPKLAELVASDTSGLLRPRLPGKPAGLIAEETTLNPNDLLAYVGTDAMRDARAIYGFGAEPGYRDLIENGILILLLLGLFVLLTPVFIFVGTVSRLGGAARDRRLAALRLAGSSLAQLRRITAAESLAGAAAGLVFGSALFLLFRGAAAEFQVFRFGVYPDDLTPSWPLVVLIVLAVPALTVATAWASQRHLVVEPLGVVRETTPPKRRLWWRLLPVVLGILLIAPDLGIASELGRWALIGGAVLLMLGIPALLPWLLERAVSRIKGGPPSFQLAIRRLQSDSGTPSRVVAGLCVVLAGAIALQSLLAGQAAMEADRQDRTGGRITVYADGPVADRAIAAVRAVPGAADFQAMRSLFVDGKRQDGALVPFAVADCATIEVTTTATGCRDGDVFADPAFLHIGQSAVVTGNDKREQPWTVPVTPRPFEMKPSSVAQTLGPQVLATPAAVAGVDLAAASVTVSLRGTTGNPDFVELVRNSVAPYSGQVTVAAYNGERASTEARMFDDARDILLGGALFVLLLAGVSLLVLAQEQVRERRRALGALSATGVPVRVIVRSLLWQNGIPLLLGIVVATATGIAVAALGKRLFWDGLYVDWPAVALLAAAAVVLVLLVTASTVPSVRSAAKTENLRTE
ncbi:ABC transporter permease [Amycolatopsis keratiniphila]|uniref:ABC transporter permease n=1 Tax=Amycolatopsis keratiniphila TaxID=129921 RepID=UPI00087B85A5|nr:FtsX-like permease family protein [Amycolatopsis keratiniphila]OLZ56861.1 ABC transporter permease [Amycolatopsis keratiniphila subsp. nogabecina]SDU48053.1 FtsX-like permease family protein [Amycolatopsis keratiniphila]